MRHEAYINLQATRNVVYVDLTIPNIQRKINYLLQEPYSPNDNWQEGYSLLRTMSYTNSLL